MLNGAEWNMRAVQPGLEFRDAAGCIVNHNVQAVAGQHQTGDSGSILKLSAQLSWFGRRHGQDAFAQLGLEIRRRVTKEQLPLVE